MRSSSVLVLCLLVLVACMSLSGLRGVSADGSIQPFKDNVCQMPDANVTMIAFVASPQCQWVTVNGSVISISYQCSNFKYGNFSLSLWSNASGPCEGQPDFTIRSERGAVGIDCSVATYEDPTMSVAFYASTTCYTNWMAPAVGDVTEQSAEAHKILLHTLSSLIPQSPSSAIHRLARLIADKQTQ